MKGIKLVDEGVSIFNKVIKKLEEGIAWSRKEIDKETNEISKAEQKISDRRDKQEDLKANIDKASRIMSKVQDIIV